MMTRRQFYVALVVLGMSGLVGGLLGQWLLQGSAAWAQDAGVAKEVRCGRLALVDEAGRGRAALTMTDGKPTLALYDEAGHARATLALYDGEPRLGFSDAEGHARAALGIADGSPMLGFSDAAGQPRALLGLALGETNLVLFDAAGRIQWRAP